MQFIYRGHPYNVASPAIDAMEIHGTATFLGKRYARKQFSVAYRHQPSEELIYRGVRYAP